MNKTTLIAAVATAYATAVTASLASTNTASLGGMVLASAGGRKPPLDPAGKSGRFFLLTVSEGRDSMANRARIPSAARLRWTPYSKYACDKNAAENEVAQGLLEISDPEAMRQRGFSLLGIKPYAEKIGMRGLALSLSARHFIGERN